MLNLQAEDVCWLCDAVDGILLVWSSVLLILKRERSAKGSNKFYVVLTGRLSDTFIHAVLVCCFAVVLKRDKLSIWCTLNTGC